MEHHKRVQQRMTKLAAAYVELHYTLNAAIRGGGIATGLPAHMIRTWVCPQAKNL